MSDSDGYFDDSFVLDETALALLQHEEEKFYSTQAPPSTVVKTAQQGSNGKAIRRKLDSHDDNDDDDDQFDVIVRDDGSYAFGGHIGTPILQHSRTDITSTSARVASVTDHVQFSNVQSSNKTRLSSVIPPVNKASAFLEPPTATALPPGLTKINKPSRLHNDSSVVDILKGPVDNQLQAEVARLKTQLTEVCARLGIPLCIELMNHSLVEQALHCDS